MPEFYDDLDFILDKMDTQYCTYPIVVLYEWIYTYYFGKKSN